MPNFVAVILVIGQYEFTRRILSVMLPTLKNLRIPNYAEKQEKLMPSVKCENVAKKIFDFSLKVCSKIGENLSILLKGILSSNQKVWTTNIFLKFLYIVEQITMINKAVALQAILLPYSALTDKESWKNQPSLSEEKISGQLDNALLYLCITIISILWTDKSWTTSILSYLEKGTGSKRLRGNERSSSHSPSRWLRI